MICNKTISCIIPCYNEEDGLLRLLPNMPRFFDEVVIVDNNSSDRTVDIARSFGCTVLHEPKQGYGATYKRGFRYAKSDIIVTMDGDNTYPLEEIERCVGILLEDAYDFISCSRFPLADRDSMDFSNVVGNTALTLLTVMLFGKCLKDSQSGMWIFKQSVFKDIFPHSDDMALSQEIKVLALLHPSVRFREVHIRYKPRVGEVKLRKWRDGFQNLTQLVKMKLRKC